ncbi:MAG TPA: FecR domain-containing protein [Planctomycetota bacterium]|nr:FecR domain-containing protein [Planctomycetota bacterium]
MTCPDTLTLRIFAEGELDDSRKVEQHVARCETCRMLVEQARREERVLREQLKVEMPERLHENTIKALDNAAKRRVSSRRAPQAGGSSWRWAGLLMVLAVGGGVTLALCLPSKTPAPEIKKESAPAQPTETTTPPAPVESSSDVAPPTSQSSEPAREPALHDNQITRAPGGADPITPPDQVAQVPTPAPETPREAPVTVPPTEAPKTDAKVLAVVRSGKLSAGGKALALGDALPEGEVVEAGAYTEVESADTARLLVAAGSKLSVAKGEGGRPVFFVASGKLLASSLGTGRYSVASADARTTPMGTQFLVAVESGKTRVSTLEGHVRVDVERVAAEQATVDVRAGFEADVAKGKTAEAPKPFVASRAVAWLPEASRPKSLPAQPRVVATFGFEDGQAFTQGTIVAGGAHGSKHALRGVALDEGTLVELSDERAQAIELDKDLWVELTCKVNKATTVAIEIGPGHHRRPDHTGGPGPGQSWPRREPGLEFKTRVEAGRWTTIAAPIGEFFGGPEGRHTRDTWRRATHEKLGDHLGRFTVVASPGGRGGGEPPAQGRSETVELLVDDVRFYRYDE